MDGDKNPRAVAKAQPSTPDCAAATLNSICPAAISTTHSNVRRSQRVDTTGSAHLAFGAWGDWMGLIDGSSATPSLQRQPSRPDKAGNRVHHEACKRHHRRLIADQHDEQDDQDHDRERNAPAKVDGLEAVVLEIADHRKTREKRDCPGGPSYGFGVDGVVVDNPHKTGD